MIALSRGHNKRRSGISPGGSLTVGEFLTLWLDGKQRLRASTSLAYRIHVERHIGPAIGSLPLAELSLNHLQTLYAGLRDQGTSAATVQRIHATLSSALNAAVRRGLIQAAPTVWVELARAHAVERQVWSFDQAQVFLTGIRGDEWEPVFRLLLLTGLRRGEVLGLRWCDVGLDRRIITVRQQLVQVGAELVVNPPKSRRGTRAVSVDTTTLSVLASGPQGSSGELVFTDQSGQPLRPALVSRRFERIAADLGLPRIRLHDLRHTSASLGLAAGESLLEVSRRLGHSSVSITGDAYSHLDPTLTRASADRLAGLCETEGPSAHQGEVIVTDWRTDVARHLGSTLRELNQRIEQVWLWHCQLFDADPRYRLLIVGLADLLARRIDPSQLLQWLQRLIMQHLLGADLDL